MMILKTESSHTFKELGFHFRNKNVHDYLKDQAPELREICLGTRKYYIWKLPIDNRKALKFAEVVSPPKKRFNLTSSTTTRSWELRKINGKQNFDPFYTPSLTISFQIKKDEKEIYLKNLYPTFPKVSGVDILQFLMSLSYSCGFTLSVRDESDLCTSYKLLYGSGYYENLIKGIQRKTINQDIMIVKENFYKCANDELQNLDLMYPGLPFNKFLNSCREKDISVQDCPVHFLWLGNVIHSTLIPKCGLNKKPYPDFFPLHKLEFQITSTDLTRIFNKILPKFKPILYPIVKNCSPKVKDFETVQKDITLLKFFEHAFDFCFPDDPKFTTLKLFKTLKGCVTETLNFLWKNECVPNE
jgi:hypothetical protein